MAARRQGGGSAASSVAAPRQEARQQHCSGKRGGSAAAVVVAVAAAAACRKRGGGGGSGQHVGSATAAGMATSAATTAVLPARRRGGNEDTGGNSDGGGTDNNQQQTTKRSGGNSDGNGDDDSDNNDDGKATAAKAAAAASAAAAWGWRLVWRRKRQLGKSAALEAAAARRWRRQRQRGGGSVAAAVAAASSLAAEARLSKFEFGMKKQFIPCRGKSNLTKFQAGILEKICNDKNIIIAYANKNFGPVGVDAKQNIQWGLQEHLLDPTTYQLISEEDAKIAANKLFTTIYQRTRKHSLCDHLTKDSKKYIRQKIRDTTSDPFGYFYLTIKIHKTPISMRPICSNLASQPHSLGQWVAFVLQPVVTSQTTYFKDSFALKRKLNTLVIPPNASLFTYDGVSMYTYIEIDNCLEQISTFLTTIWDKAKYSAVISAMEIRRTE